MFNKDALFGKKDEPPRSEPTRTTTVNVTPGLGGSNSVPVRPQPQPQTPPQPAAADNKPDLRFAEVQKPAPQPLQARSEETTGSRLIVGPDIKLKGVEITDCDTLEVEGRVEASMDSRLMIIKQTGVFAGTVSIDVAEIHGRFEGELTARKQLVIYSTGRVTGTIRYGKVRIEEGGEVSGQVSTLAKAPAAGSSTSTASAGPTSSTPSSTAPATSAAGGSAPPTPSIVPAAAAAGSGTPSLVASRSIQSAESLADEMGAPVANRDAARSSAPAKPTRPNTGAPI